MSLVDKGKLSATMAANRLRDSKPWWLLHQGIVYDNIVPDASSKTMQDITLQSLDTSSICDTPEPFISQGSIRSPPLGSRAV